MAESKAKKSAPKTVKAEPEAEPEVIAEEEAKPEPAKASAPKPKARTLGPTDYATVRNGTQGVLIYKNVHTGETFYWEKFGDEQEMELRELKNAKSSNKKFFINNWFLFDDPAVIDYLGVGQYYKYALNTDEFNDLFSKSAEEIAAILPNLSAGQKKSVGCRAYQLIKEGSIDSMKTIKALEEGLGVRLIESEK